MDDYEIECDFRAARWGAADSIQEHLPAIAEGLPTLRDRFAMAAISGLLADSEYMVSWDEAARAAYAIADAMLEARKEER